ncbi:hypothetical protein [Actinospica robiniae]|uniref:hypothetical protein n=1 Tax=Actinospica robiniae TaxID=304901 RepID=UPI00040F0E3B|nr:hypothetical protein [Actinospica robiniae]
MGMTTENQGVRRIERLEGNIGYLETEALVAEPGDAAPFVTAAMTALADTDALILDLRGEGGDDGRAPSGVSSWSCGAVPADVESVRLDQPVYLLTAGATGTTTADGAGVLSASLVPDFAVPAEEALAVAYQHALRKLPPRPTPVAKA